MVQHSLMGSLELGLQLVLGDQGTDTEVALQLVRPAKEWVQGSVQEEAQSALQVLRLMKESVLE